MHKTLALSALLLGSTLLTATPSEAAPPRAHWHHVIAHPRAHSDEARIKAWEREHARVLSAAATFPSKLD